MRPESSKSWKVLLIEDNFDHAAGIAKALEPVFHGELVDFLNAQTADNLPTMMTKEKEGRYTDSKGHEIGTVLRVLLKGLKPKEEEEEEDGNESTSTYRRSATNKPTVKRGDSNVEFRKMITEFEHPPFWRKGAGLSRAGLDSETRAFLNGNNLNLQVMDDAPFGTLFLDELADMHPEVQSQLLRLVEYGELKPLGYGGTIRLRDSRGRLHIQFIAATNSPWVISLVVPCNSETQSNQSIEPSNQFASYNGLTVRADLVYRMPHVLKLDPLQSNEVAIEEGNSWHPGALILLESHIHDPQQRVSWTKGALIHFHGCSKDLKGNRRQARMIAARAISKVLNRDRMGTDPFTRNYEITEEILKAAIAPISVKPEIQIPPPPGTSTDISADERSSFCEQVRDFVRYHGFWEQCEEVTWVNLIDSELIVAQKCAAFLCSVKFQKSSHPKTNQLEKLWLAGRRRSDKTNGKSSQNEQEQKSGTVQSYFRQYELSSSDGTCIFEEAYRLIEERLGVSIPRVNAGKLTLNKALVAVFEVLQNYSGKTRTFESKS